jgi:hypothetical protein
MPVSSYLFFKNLESKAFKDNLAQGYFDSDAHQLCEWSE